MLIFMFLGNFFSYTLKIIYVCLNNTLSIKKMISCLCGNSLTRVNIFWKRAILL